MHALFIKILVVIAYEATYSGPIGSVITPHLKGMDEWKHLSYASSLCGNCTEVCAVKINLHELLLENRHEAVDEGDSSFAERTGMEIMETGNAQTQPDEYGKRKNKKLGGEYFIKRMEGTSKRDGVS